MALVLAWSATIDAVWGGLSDFRIYADPQALFVCQPSSAQFTVHVVPLVGDYAVILSADVPPGTSASFLPNPVVAPGTSVLTVFSTGSATPGTYDVRIVGSSALRTQATGVVLGIAAGAPSVPELAYPIDPQADVSRNAALSWRSSSPAFSHIEVASDPGFTDIAFTATVVESRQIAGSGIETPPLAADSTFYWRAAAENGCGGSAFATAASFATGAGLSAGRVTSVGPLSIPDALPSGISSARTLDPPVQELVVELAIEHSFVGQLTVDLVHLDTGTEARLIDRPGVPATGSGCPGEDIRAQLSDSVAASRPVEDECSPIAPAIGQPWFRYEEEPTDRWFRGVFAPAEPLSTFSGESLSGTWMLRVVDHVAGSLGVLGRWCLSTGSGLRLCSWPQSPIPDGDGSARTDILTFPIRLTDLDVALDITHTWVGDLEVQLTAPAATPVALIERPGSPAQLNGCSEDDIRTVLDDDGPPDFAENSCATTGAAISGRLRPNQSLAALDGRTTTGSWQLKIADHVGGDIGQLESWTLIPSGTAVLIFSHGFETGTTEGWSLAVPP